MSNTQQLSQQTTARTVRPKTWEHLERARKVPTEYEILTPNLHWRNRAGLTPFEFHSDLPANVWYTKNSRNSRISHRDWNEFRDPVQLVYRTYNISQDTHESYIDGLLHEYSEQKHDEQLTVEWVKKLATLYAPLRYPLHALQMASSYIVHMAPATSISNCAAFQAADSYRWISRIAYRTRELSKTHPEIGFGEKERQLWEEHSAWQGLRELLERALTAYDWGESFFAVNAFAKIAIDEACLRQFGVVGQQQGDGLIRLLCDAQLQDSERSRRWTESLIRFCLSDNPANEAAVIEWSARWRPLAEQAVAVFCQSLPDPEAITDGAKDGLRQAWERLGLPS
jgi:toluene monooxygenase system protein E